MSNIDIKRCRKLGSTTRHLCFNSQHWWNILMDWYSSSIFIKRYMSMNSQLPSELNFIILPSSYCCIVDTSSPSHSFQPTIRISPQNANPIPKRQTSTCKYDNSIDMLHKCQNASLILPCSFKMRLWLLVISAKVSSRTLNRVKSDTRPPILEQVPAPTQFPAW